MKLIEMKLYNNKYIDYVVIKDDDFFLAITKKEYENLKHRGNFLLKKNFSLRKLVKK